MNNQTFKYQCNKQYSIQQYHFLKMMKGFHTSLTTFRLNDSKNTPKIQGRKLLTQDNHQVGDYGLLNKAINNHLQRKKKKKVQTFSDCISHCQSLDKLQLLNLQKNEEIKRYIYEKAEIHAQNQQLKQMITNPTLREHQLHMKINELQQANRRLTLELQKKQKDHSQEIERIRSQHKKQIQLIGEGYKLRNQMAYQQRPQTVQIKNQYVRNNEPNLRVIDSPKANVSYGQTKIYQNNVSNNQKIKIQPNKVYQPENRSESMKNYVVGSPVYISANKATQQIRPNYISTKPAQQSKPYVRQQGHSPDSKNTTSQTRVYRAESPIMPSSYNQTNSMSQGVTRIPSKPAEVRYQPQKAPQLRYSPPKIHQGRYQQQVKSYDQNYVTYANRSNDNNIKYFKTNQVEPNKTLNIRYGENDLQEIYKKYCIND